MGQTQISRYIIVGILSGILFGIMDGVINGNSCARKLYEVYKPIARQGINVPVGIAIDLIYGLALARLFLLLFRALPGEFGLAKGVSFAVIVWFLRVLMSAVSSWMMFNVPLGAVAYSLTTGLGEMLVLGILFGLTLWP